MEKIPTSEEWYEKWTKDAFSSIDDPNHRANAEEYNLMAEYFREFAKLHVQAALKAASEKVCMNFYDLASNGQISQIVEYHGYEGCDEDPILVTVQKESILSAYSLDNIK